MRAAVTHLQFLSNLIFTHKLERLTVNDLQSRYVCPMPYGQPQQGCKDQHSNLFQVAEQVLFNKPEQKVSYQVLADVRNLVTSMGDAQLLNDCLYESYNGCTYYFDDDMRKTTLFLDQLSHSTVVKQFSIRTGSFGAAEQFMYVPAYVFKRFCADVRKSKSTVQYPSVFREIWLSNQIN